MGPSLFQFFGIWIEVQSLWEQLWENLNLVALFRFAKVLLFLVDLFDHRNRNILQEVAFRIELTTH